MNKVQSINQKNLVIARENIGLDTLSASKKISTSKIDLVFEWESGVSLPTWPQISKLAKIYDISELLFFSKETIKKNKIIPDYRVGQDMGGDDRVKKLINLVIKRQKWLEQKLNVERKKNILQGSGKHIQIPKQLAVFIKEKLDINQNEIKNILGVEAQKKVLNYLIKKAEERGIFVGKTISYHKIEVRDMRGLFISNDYFPFIILNRKDSVSAQIFSFIHELAHLFRKSDAISNSLDFRQSNGTINKEEVFCNKVAAELLLPEGDFTAEFYNMSDIDNMAKVYKVSKLAIFYRLKDLNKIYKKNCDNLEREIKKEIEQNILRKNNKEKKGGDYNNNMKDSNGKLFNNIISSFYFENKINYVEASNLLKFSVEKI